MQIRECRHFREYDIGGWFERKISGDRRLPVGILALEMFVLEMPL
jgi:hypothetical protein